VAVLNKYEVVNMAIVLEDPRYKALDQVGFSLGKYLGNQWQNKKDYDTTQKFLDDESAKAQQVKNIQGLYGGFQNKYNAMQSLEGLKKNYEDLAASGATAEQLAPIANKATALRQSSLANGIDLPGADINYNDTRISDDNFARSNIDQLTSQMGKTGLFGSALGQIQPAQTSNTGLDAGATPRPEQQPVQGLLSSVGDLINEQANRYSDPNQIKAANAAFLAKNSFSPEQAAKAATMLQPRETDAKTKTNAQLINVIYNPNVNDADKLQAVQQYYELNGMDSGKILAQLAPKNSLAQEDTGATINYVSTQQPNAFGIGAPSANVIRSTSKEIAPGTRAQMSQRDKEFAANQDLNWAKFNQDANSIKHYVTTDTGDVIGFTGDGQSRTLAHTSSFSKQDQVKIKALQNNMASALQLYKTSADPYNPTAETPGMQRAMVSYNTAKGQLDSMLGVGSDQGAGQGQTQGVDYNSAISSITSALRKNSAAPAGQKWNRKQLEDYIRQSYGDMGDQLVADTDFKAFGM
jgi:hypothetical protein